MSSILIGYVIGDNKSGIDTYLLNVSAMLKEAGHEIDFLTNKKTDFMSQVCKQRGIGLIEIPTLKNIPNQFKVMKNLFHEKHYDIAYFNISEAFNSIGAIVAKQCNVKKIIVHSHNTSVGGKSKLTKTVRRILHWMFKTFIIKSFATDYWACSELAAQWMFNQSIISSKKYVVINNAIDIERFLYNPELRQKKRSELGIQNNQYVIGHVSGFTAQKNVSFLIDIINEFKELDENVRLVLAGEGEDSNLVKEKIKELQLENYVVMLGRRADVHELLQAFDTFVLPSFFEGAPVVAVEAQVAGLRVYLSDSITKEVWLSEKCHYISLKDSANVWAHKMYEEKDYNRDVTDFSKTTYCYDINKQKEILLKLFEC